MSLLLGTFTKQQNKISLKKKKVKQIRVLKKNILFFFFFTLFKPNAIFDALLKTRVFLIWAFKNMSVRFSKFTFM